jgi:lipopolysaccharide transport system permease protein
MYIFEYRELLKNLVISDLKSKYASSALGFAWSLINPLLMMIVLYLVFSNVFKSEENFAIYLLIGMFAWRFFANGTTYAMGSIVGKPGLVTKIAIPREILTLSSVISSLISSFLEFIVMIPLLLLLGVSLQASFLLFPVVHILYFLIIYGISLMIASLYVYYRDLNQIWDVIIQIGFFISPIVYPLSLVPKEYLTYYMFNPITVLIQMYRDVFLYGLIPSFLDTVYVLAIGIGLVIMGSIMFKKLSRRFAEEV